MALMDSRILTQPSAIFLALMIYLWSASTIASKEDGRVVPSCGDTPQVCVSGIETLFTESLRTRKYASVFKPRVKHEYRTSALTYMLGYDSNGLALYSRLDLPTSPASTRGFPVVVIAPGWITRQQALEWNFGLDGKSTYSPVIDHFVDKGFAVVTVGYRGRGKVRGVRADGMEFRDAWGNGSYISPIFYALDTLNVLAGLHTLNAIPWKQWLPMAAKRPVFDMSRVTLWGHSQGGDVVLTALAVAGNNKAFPQSVTAASIWSGNIADRFTQADTFEAMASTTEAFMSGDGSWTGSAVGQEGEVNPEFIFAWPADWIGTVDTGSKEWTWQAKQWSTASVFGARNRKYREMYDALNRYVKDLAHVNFNIVKDSTGRTHVIHDPLVAPVKHALGGFHFAKHIDTPLALHVSDRDYYSFPDWNQDLAERINSAGGKARVYIYPGNTHALQKSDKTWFSPPGTEAGANHALERDTALFNNSTFVD
jgi:hypothetical protein